METKKNFEIKNIELTTSDGEQGINILLTDGRKLFLYYDEVCQCLSGSPFVGYQRYEEAV